MVGMSFLRELAVLKLFETGESKRIIAELLRAFFQDF